MLRHSTIECWFPVPQLIQHPTAKSDLARVLILTGDFYSQEYLRSVPQSQKAILSQTGDENKEKYQRGKII